MKRLAERGSIPTRNFQRIQMKNSRQRIQFVQAWHHLAILDIGQTADVQHKVRTPAIHCNQVAGFLYIAIGEAQRLSSLS
jgi:hypothetical protein